MSLTDRHEGTLERPGAPKRLVLPTWRGRHCVTTAEAASCPTAAYEAEVANLPLNTRSRVTARCLLSASCQTAWELSEGTACGRHRPSTATYVARRSQRRHGAAISWSCDPPALTAHPSPRASALTTGAFFVSGGHMLLILGIAGAAAALVILYNELRSETRTRRRSPHGGCSSSPPWCWCCPRPWRASWTRCRPASDRRWLPLPRAGPHRRPRPAGPHSPARSSTCGRTSMTSELTFLDKIRSAGPCGSG